MRRAAVLALALLAACPRPGAAQRLPGTVLPEHYDIHLSPDFATNEFQGEETIAVRLAEPSSHITLHAVELDLREARITAGGRTERAAVSVDARSETATFTVPVTLPAGPAHLQIRFAGRLNGQLRGFYLSRGSTRTYAVTQLEATDARRAFPCFDEPAMKATFALSVTIDSRDTAISNGRLVSDTPGPGAGRHTLRFSTTPKMSSYLVAVAVGDFVCSAGSADGVPIRVCATPDKQPLTAFALEAAEVILRFYNRYFSIPYPFGKLDIVAVPDFAAGAMENTGAIFYREQLLLIDNVASRAARMQVADILAHEMAHQWLGDLVTMQWWDDIWLNEGFATWMEGKPLQAWKPEWNVPVEDQREMQRALGTDALQSTRAIRTPVETPAEINEVFDAIAYQKAGAVLGMVEAYVGPEAFRHAVNAYVKKYAYGNATGEQFWTELGAVAGRKADEVLASFVTRVGEPIITVERSCESGNTRVRLTQGRFSANREEPESSKGGAWQVPVCLKLPGPDGRAERATCRLLAQPSETFTLSGCAPWMFVNADGLGYFRTAYDRESLRDIGLALSAGALTAPEQISLVEDSWALARAGREDVAGFLGLAGQLLKGQLSPAVQPIMNRLDYIGSYLADGADRERFQAWVRQALGPAAAGLGWDSAPGENEDRRATRVAVLYTLGYTGRDPDTLEEARRRVDAYLAGQPPDDPGMLDVLLPLAAARGDARLYERFFDRSLRAATPGEQYRFRNALAFFPDPALLERTLEYSTSSEIRGQDAPSFLAALLQHPLSRPRTWSHIKANWPAMERMGVFQGLPVIARATAAFCDPDAREDVSRFFESRAAVGVERTVKQALETIDACVAFRGRQGPALSQFLDRSGVGAN